jgi:hypothetical protein
MTVSKKNTVGIHNNEMCQTKQTYIMNLNKIQAIHNNEFFVNIQTNKQNVTLLIINSLNKLMHNELNLLIEKNSKPSYESEQMGTKYLLFTHRD